MNPSADSPETRIALFQRQQVRRTIHNHEWWFVISDVIAALTDSTNPSDYLKKMRRRDPLLAAAFKGGDKLSAPCTVTPIPRRCHWSDSSCWFRVFCVHVRSVMRERDVFVSSICPFNSTRSS